MYTIQPSIYEPKTCWIMHDRELSDEEVMRQTGERCLLQAQKTFDTMWHAFMPMTRPLSKDEYSQYKEIFHHILDLHQEVYRKGRASKRED